MSRRKPRSPGVMLRNRALGNHRWDDELNCDGGKAKAHRLARRRERAAWKRDIDNEFRSRSPRDSE